jgi:F0F1-type ATP synthase membrane subunit b/b'
MVEGSPLDAVRDLERRIQDRLAELGASGAAVEQAREGARLLLDEGRKQADRDAERLRAERAAETTAQVEEVDRSARRRSAQLGRLAARRLDSDVLAVLAAVLPGVR